MFSYRYPRPALTADCVIFSISDNGPSVLLIRRGNEPFKGCWAFPGGFAEEGETIEQTAARELFEETHLSDVLLHQFHVFSRPGRDPRGWTVSVAFWGILEPDKKSIAVGGDDADAAQWFPIDKLPPLAFDHHEILEKAIKALHRKD